MGYHIEQAKEIAQEHTNPQSAIRNLHLISAVSYHFRRTAHCHQC